MDIFPDRSTNLLQQLDQQHARVRLVGILMRIVHSERLMRQRLQCIHSDAGLLAAILHLERLRVRIKLVQARIPLTNAKRHNVFIPNLLESSTPSYRGAEGAFAWTASSRLPAREVLVY